MRIEPADVGDADILADLWVDLANDQRAHGTHLLADDNRDRIREALLRRIVTGDVLVARGDVEGAGGIAGFVSFGVESRGYEIAAERGVVYNLYVRPDFRDEGVGHDLLSAAEDHLAAAGVEAVTLEAMADNEKARRFYRRHGYELHRVELEKPLAADQRSGEASTDVDPVEGDDPPDGGDCDGSG